MRQTNLCRELVHRLNALLEHALPPKRSHKAFRAGQREEESEKANNGQTLQRKAEVRLVDATRHSSLTVRRPHSEPIARTLGSQARVILICQNPLSHTSSEEKSLTWTIATLGTTPHPPSPSPDKTFPQRIIEVSFELCSRAPDSVSGISGPLGSITGNILSRFSSSEAISG